jgi:condensin complex subunit 1
LLPDIISQLSQVSIAKEDFRNILSFLLGYIKKEKQNETLIDKLCQRFPKCTTISQKADIAYCMAQLKVNERSIKRLIDNFKLYKDALFDDEVKRHFFSIITKAKKFSKPELKQCLEEWETKLNEHAEIGMENEIAGEKAAQAKAQATKRSSKRRQQKRIESIPEWSEEEEELESDGDDKENAPRPSTDTTATKQGTRQSRRGASEQVQA